MQRIMIIGQPGSGKSTLARQLGARLDLPVFHMDRDVFWLPGWTAREKPDQLRQVKSIVAREVWIFEGYNSPTFELRGARADMLIWLDMPLSLRLYRVVRRTVRGRGKSRPDMGEGCPEQLSMLPEFLWYILRTWRRNRAKAQVFFDGFEQTKHRLRSLQDVTAFVEGLPVQNNLTPEPQSRL